MQTIRRVYLYLVSLISLETVLWGVIGLARSALAEREVGGGVERLAGALALILVGVPVLILHGWLAQRSATQDVEERASTVRAIFLYTVLLATWIPAVQNALALVNHALLKAFDLNLMLGILGESQSISESLVALVANLLVGAYFWHWLSQDWRVLEALEGTSSGIKDNFVQVRRVYRLVWMLYGLGLVVFGVQQVLRYVLMIWDSLGSGAESYLANGLALLIAGIPLWLWTSRVVRGSLRTQAETVSTVHMLVLYALVLVSIIVVLASGGLVLYQVLRILLGQPTRLAGFLFLVANPFSTAIPFAAIWAYYGQQLRQTIMAHASRVGDVEQAERVRAGLRRLYLYVLAAIGLTATFVGLQLLLSYIIDFAWSTASLGEGGIRDQLASALATLISGLPLWLVAWRQIEHQVAQVGEVGDHARRSTLRRVYLFLGLFAGVIGAMVAIGTFLYQLIRYLLGSPPLNFGLELSQQAGMAGLFAALLAYHGQVLRQDLRRAEQALANRHAQFPVLILAPDQAGEEWQAQGEFAAGLVSALQKLAPSMPVAVHSYALGVPDESLSAAQAVILPAELAAHPPEGLRLWLQAFPGSRLVLPTPVKGWWWVAGSGRSLTVLTRQTARLIRQMAEREELTAQRETSPWMVLLYILAGLLGLILISGLVNLVMEG